MYIHVWGQIRNSFQLGATGGTGVNAANRAIQDHKLGADNVYTMVCRLLDQFAVGRKGVHSLRFAVITRAQVD